MIFFLEAVWKLENQRIYPRNNTEFYEIQADLCFIWCSFRVISRIKMSEK